MTKTAPKAATADVVAGAKSFADQLAELERGSLNHELSSQLNELVKQVRKTGRAGALTLKIGIKPCDAIGQQVEIAADVSLKLPKAPRERTLAFTTDAGGLQREDPRQMNLRGIDDHE